MRMILYAAFLVLIGPLTAEAQVIEIADDGSAQVFEGRSSVGGYVARSIRTGRGAFNIEESFKRAAHANRLDIGLLRAVAWQESRGSNAAVSSKGALGIMQLMPGTAAALGVNPRDPEANINGGAAYLARQLATFGTVPLALAAYNAGPGAVQRYGGVPPFSETRAYVATIMRRWTGSEAVPTLAPGPTPAKRRERALPVLLIEVPSE